MLDLLKTRNLRKLLSKDDMKIILLALLIPTIAFASECEVGGISDSPQSYRCLIRSGKVTEKLSLICNQGIYQVKWQDNIFNVTDAYHEDVETGASPLVFLSDRIKLKTVSNASFIKAYLENDGQRYTGKCFNN